MHFIPEWSTTRIVTSEVEPTDADRHNNKIYGGPTVNVLKQVLRVPYLPEHKTTEGERCEESQDIARYEIEPVTLQKTPLGHQTFKQSGKPFDKYIGRKGLSVIDYDLTVKWRS